MLSKMKETADTMFKRANSPFRFNPEVSVEFLNKGSHFYQ